MRYGKPLYRDRQHAGRVLAKRLATYRGRPHLQVLGLPRGGVVVAYEVARALAAPLDVFVVRKLGMPGHEEFAIGAIAGGGVQVMNPQAGYAAGDAAVQAVVAREAAELQRREQRYRDGLPPPDLHGAQVIVVDDGLATGSTMRAALQALRQQQPAQLVAAVPVGAADTCAQLHGDADAVVCAAKPSPFRAVGLWYEHFAQTDDDEVQTLLAQARHLQT